MASFSFGAGHLTIVRAEPAPALQENDWSAAQSLAQLDAATIKSVQQRGGKQ